MMWLLSVLAFLTLGTYLVALGIRHGVPSMVSDTYYQLQESRHCGWVFSLVMVMVAFIMLACIMDLGKGIQCLAFLGCGGLAFVGAAPNYCNDSEYKVHKTGAIIAAIGCVGWCLSVCWWVTLCTLLAYALYLGTMELLKTLNGIWYFSRKLEYHPWYWAEVAGFANTFITYWVVSL